MYKSLNELIIKENKTQTPLWELVMLDDCRERNVNRETAFNEMKSMYIAMKDSLSGYESDLKSNSGLVGGEAAILQEYVADGNSLCGDFVSSVMVKALKIAESNACMKRIVAAPTAGSCGVVPAVFLSIQEKMDYSDDQMTEALYVAAGVGGVIANRASLAGAEGGCQAEIGAASSMAAAGLTYLLGGKAVQQANAAALALKNLLGLACDPVAGLVEIPCVKRNVCGAVNAVTSAELTMAGITSRIPADEVFDAMSSIGKNMSDTIKETGLGGLAATATGCSIKDSLIMN